MIGRMPAAMFIPVPILAFFHPTWFIFAAVAWMAITFWLARKGLGIGGMKLLIRRWLQGSRLVPRRRKPTV